MKISVVIPTHNRAPLLQQAIESVLQQEPCGAEVEVVVVDDGSTDETPAVVGSYPSVRYVRTKQGTAAGSRNVGISRVQGEWIAFLDDDDVWLPHKLRECCRLAADNPQARFIFSAATVCDHELHPLSMWAGPDMMGNKPYEAFLDEVITPSVVMMHKAVFEEIGLFDPSVPRAEDRDMWLRAVAHGFACASTPEPLVLYRERKKLDGEQVYQNYGTTMTVVRRYFGSDRSLCPSWRRRQQILLRVRGFYAYYLLMAARQAAQEREWRRALRFCALALGISPFHTAKNWLALAAARG